MTKFIVGVMGPGGGARDEDVTNARELDRSAPLTPPPESAIIGGDVSLWLSHTRE
jgi:hypothetical protein